MFVDLKYCKNRVRPRLPCKGILNDSLQLVMEYTRFLFPNMTLKYNKILDECNKCEGSVRGQVSTFDIIGDWV